MLMTIGYDHQLKLGHLIGEILANRYWERGVTDKGSAKGILSHSCYREPSHQLPQEKSWLLE